MLQISLAHEQLGTLTIIMKLDNSIFLILYMRVHGIFYGNGEL